MLSFGACIRRMVTYTHMGFSYVNVVFCGVTQGSLVAKHFSQSHVLYVTPYN